MNDLLKFTIEAHGGLDNWKKYERVNAKLIGGGVIWAFKQQPNIVNDINVTCSTRQQYASYYPFVQSDWHNTFNPEKVAIIDSKEEMIEELQDPRSSFQGHQTATPWSKLQASYFMGYAIWTYLNAPFNFAGFGYQVRELDAWRENNESFRCLEVTFPASVATHCSVQTFYIDAEGLIKRHDYSVDIMGGTASAHYLSDYVEVQGIKFATQRKVYGKTPDNLPVLTGPLYVSIGLSNIKLS